MAVDILMLKKQVSPSIYYSQNHILYSMLDLCRANDSIRPSMRTKNYEITGNLESENRAEDIINTSIPYSEPKIQSSQPLIILEYQ